MAEIAQVQGTEADGDPLARMGLDPVKAAEVLATYKADLAKLKDEAKAWKAEQVEYGKLKEAATAAEQARLSDVEKANIARDKEARRAQESRCRTRIPRPARTRSSLP